MSTLMPRRPKMESQRSTGGCLRWKSFQRARYRSASLSDMKSEIATLTLLNFSLVGGTARQELTKTSSMKTSSPAQRLMVMCSHTRLSPCSVAHSSSLRQSGGQSSSSRPFTRNRATSALIARLRFSTSTLTKANNCSRCCSIASAATEYRLVSDIGRKVLGLAAPNTTSGNEARLRQASEQLERMPSVRPGQMRAQTLHGLDVDLPIVDHMAERGQLRRRQPDRT